MDAVNDCTRIPSSVFAGANDRPAFPVRPLDRSCVDPAPLAESDRQEVIRLVRLVQTDFDPAADSRGWDCVAELMREFRPGDQLRDVDYPELAAFFRVRHEQLKDQLRGAIETTTPSIVSYASKQPTSPPGGKETPRRQRSSGATGAPYRAAFWMYETHDLLPDSEPELLAAVASADGKPRLVYRAFNLHGFEVDLSAVRNRVPECWPCDADGNRLSKWAFADFAADVNEESFDRYIRRHSKLTGGQVGDGSVYRNHGRQESLPSCETPTRRRGVSRKEIKKRAVVSAVEKAEEAVSLVRRAIDTGNGVAAAWRSLGTTLAKDLRLAEPDIKELVGGLGKDAVDRVATFLVQRRADVGDDGDMDPKNRTRA